MSEDAELHQVIAQSRENNAAADITGVLLYCNGSIIQVLEGEKKVLDGLYGKIKKDDRHTHVTLLFNGGVENRLFDKWAMGYTTIDKREMEELRDQLSFIDNPYQPSVSENKILSLLQTFFKNNYRN